MDFGEFIALFGDSLEQPLRTVSQEDISALQATLEQRHGIRILECGRRPCPPSLTSSNTILEGTQNPNHVWISIITATIGEVSVGIESFLNPTPTSPLPIPTPDKKYFRDPVPHTCQ